MKAKKLRLPHTLLLIYIMVVLTVVLIGWSIALLGYEIAT